MQSVKNLLFAILIVSLGCNQAAEKKCKVDFGAAIGDTAPLVSIIDDRPENFATDTGTITNDGLVYYSYDEAPKFGKTDSVFKQYIKSSIHYPAQAKADKVQGTVYVSFVVLSNGCISQSKIIRGVRDDIDQECLRVIRNMPRWEPGKKNGKTVNIQLQLPIVFSIDKFHQS